MNKLFLASFLILVACDNYKPPALSQKQITEISNFCDSHGYGIDLIGLAKCNQDRWNCSSVSSVACRMKTPGEK